MDTLRFVCFFSLRPKVGEIIGDNLSTMYLLGIYVYIYIPFLCLEILVYTAYTLVFIFTEIYDRTCQVKSFWRVNAWNCHR